MLFCKLLYVQEYVQGIKLRTAVPETYANAPLNDVPNEPVRYASLL